MYSVLEKAGINHKFLMEVSKMKEFEWLGKHPDEKAKYRGEYIVVVGEKIVAHGKDLKVVIEKAKNYLLIL
jgi:hypothetical protein